MKVISCENCGSNDLIEENGYRICPYCGTKHLIEQEDRPDKSSTISLKKDVETLLLKCRENPERAEKYAQLILEIDPNNAEAKGFLNSKPATNTSGGCYIATAVYGSYDCPQVWTLRRYRDFTLAKSRTGRLFIRLYYAVSPTIVKWFGEKKWFVDICKRPLDKIVKRLNDEGVAATPYQDR